MKEGISKTSDKEKEKLYGKLVILMKVNSNKIKYTAMVFLNGKMVKDTLEIGNTTIIMVMVLVTGQMVICIKVNTNVTNKQE